MKKTSKIVQLEEVICAAANIKREDLDNRRRDQAIIDARHVIWFIAHDYLNMSYQLIGAMYGGRDHSTIVHGVKKIRKSKISTSIVSKIKKKFPELFQLVPMQGDPKSIGSWEI